MKIQEIRNYIYNENTFIDFMNRFANQNNYYTKDLKSNRPDLIEVYDNFLKLYKKCWHCKKYFKKSKSNFCDSKECQDSKNNLSKSLGFKIKTHKSKLTKEERQSIVLKSKQTKLERYNNENYNNSEKQEQTMLEKYGVRRALESDILNLKMRETLKSKSEEEKQSYVLKVKQTKLERYGNGNYNNPEKISQILKSKSREEKQAAIAKCKQTKLERYNNENYNNISKNFETKMDRYGSKSYNNIKKIKETCLEKYGVETPLESKEIQEKARKSKLERYGSENYNNQVQIKATCLKRYGVEHAMQSEIFKEKMLNTNILKYGFMHPNQAHIKNYQNYNETFVKENFIANELFLGKEFSEYFGIAHSVNSKYKAKFKITVPTKIKYQEAEHNFLNCFANAYQVKIQKQVSVVDNYKVDGFFNAQNDFKINDIRILKGDQVILEFLGDFWHGYKNDDTLNAVNKKTFKQLYGETFERFNKILQFYHSSDLKCKILYVWESEFKKDLLKAVKEYKYIKAI